MGIIEQIFKPVGDLLSVSPMVAMLLCVGALIVLVAIIVIIAVSVKRKKARSKAINPALKEEIAIEPSIATTKDDSEQITEEKDKEETNVKKEEKKTVAKPAPAKKSAPVKKAEPKPVKKVVGKWVIEHKSDDEYLSKLIASNGEVMLTSEIYKSEDGAEAGIASICRGIDSGKFVIYQDKNKNYYYKLKTSGNRLLCVGEIYKSKDQCLKAVESVKRIAKDSPLDEDVLMGKEYVKYIPQKLNEAEINKSAKGKWKIEKNEQGEFYARLYANNGQIMLSTEEVALKKSAENAIEGVKKNSAAGNFIIDRDKFGRFYYKLRNAQKSVICIGEAYESLDSCISAIESVRRFAANSDVPTAEK